MTFILFIAVIILIFALISNKKKLKKTINDLQNIINSLNSKIKNLEQERENLNQKIEFLEDNNNSLKKYQGIVDTEQKAKDILFKANLEATELLENAKTELENAILESKAVKSKANIDATNFKQNAINLLNNATTEAKSIIEKAEIKATEIAGDAYKAMQNSKELEKTAKAMKNIIEGYGNKYLVPTFSLLDDLAEEFGHTDAGQKLKFSREKTNLMINNGTSAKCDYVEANRKEIAINFILDAFNGKVDSVLSKVKKDNYGTLEQKIKDAYQVVNNNGKAFRNAIITEEYLNSRIDELKWAVITQELKWQEQEEQRRIKEQIREEEKARREFEKAIREAQKEEETLKKLIDKAQKEVSQANNEQKFKFEEKLRELEEKLKIAEDKNQRAISMAQQTKSGNVYVISNIGSFGENVFKIGMTRRLEPLDRIKELGDASVPFEFDVHSMIFSNDAPKLERELHKKFMRLQMNKVNPRKEFFKVTLSDIKDEVEKMEINAKWTMTADALQYRESLAIEEEISKDKQKELEWQKFQLKAEEIIAETEEEIREEIEG
ncbi:DUF4041 domain-containing protein [Flavobacterium marginilacus]|uniref:DUF4041 domain-containing protein n=1 Tax=Flavobacterium marginilacus TaxID=3003256 RepID=UPI00248F2715|nr:DUF4041 domain-containing protein [Flavobacterium marginilacus]